jgi:hypothetical protein
VTFTVGCPNDGTHLITWQLLAGQVVVHDDGRDHTWTEERVGMPHDARNVGAALEGDDAHFTYVIDCPDCSYRSSCRPRRCTVLCGRSSPGCPSTSRTPRRIFLVS